MRPELFTLPGIHIPISGYGAMVAIAFLGSVWWMTRNARRLKADEDIVLNIGFIALIFSCIGAHTFYVIHHWQAEYAHQPLRALNPLSGGFEFYGGFIGAFVASFLYLWYKKLSIRLYADLVAPSLLFGMGIGRIGCFFYGCCWGAACPPEMAWAVQFPCSSLPYQQQWDERQVTLPAELILTDPTGSVFTTPTRYAGPLPRQIAFLTPSMLYLLEKGRERAQHKLESAETGGNDQKIGKAQQKQQHFEALFGHLDTYQAGPGTFEAMIEQFGYRSRAVHPAQLYSAIGPLLLAVLTYCYLYRRKRHGTVLPIGYMLYAVERFIEESIRLDNPIDTLGLTVSQSISIVIFGICLATLFLLRRLPLRSPAPVRPACRETEDPTAAAT